MKIPDLTTTFKGRNFYFENTLVLLMREIDVRLWFLDMVVPWEIMLYGQT